MEGDGHDGYENVGLLVENQLWAPQPEFMAYFSALYCFIFWGFGLFTSNLTTFCLHKGSLNILVQLEPFCCGGSLFPQWDALATVLIGENCNYSFHFGSFRKLQRLLKITHLFSHRLELGSLSSQFFCPHKYFHIWSNLSLRGGGLHLWTKKNPNKVKHYWGNRDRTVQTVGSCLSLASPLAVLATASALR